MHILVMASDVPHHRDGRPGVTAVHIVLYTLVQQFRRQGHDVTVQLILGPLRVTDTLNEAEQAEIQSLEQEGVRFLPVIFPNAYLMLRTPLRIREMAGPASIEKLIPEFYPAWNLRKEVRQRIGEIQPDVIVPVWSKEGIAATDGIETIPRVAFHGDLDFEPQKVRRIAQAMFFSDKDKDLFFLKRWIDGLASKIRLRAYERAHWALIKTVDSIANVTARNGDYYAKKGHPRSVYVSNFWLDPGPQPLQTTLERMETRPPGAPFKIIGHAGNLGATGGSFGLQFLLGEAVERLERLMEDRPFEIHIIGGGTMSPALLPLTKNKHIKLRGFVEDLEKELDESDAFLLLNNAAPYVAAFTRHMVAWSRGLCLIVHANSRLAVPEITPGVNALTCGTPAELAQVVFKALTQPELNRSIRTEGRSTFEKYFTGEAVARRVLEECSYQIQRRKES